MELRTWKDQLKEKAKDLEIEVKEEKTFPCKVCHRSTTSETAICDVCYGNYTMYEVKEEEEL